MARRVAQAEGGERSSGSAVGREGPSDPLLGRAVMVDVMKGGYGKSTLSMNLADRIAAMGKDVLYIDLDPNGHTHVLGYDEVYNDIDHDYGYVVSDKGPFRKANREPEELIYTTEWGWDFVPSYADLEAFNETLMRMDGGSQVLAKRFLMPLFERGQYDFCIMDGGGERSKVADNGFVAGRRAIIPICPGEESISAINRTWDRVIQPLTEKYNEFELLAVTPNKLNQRIDQRTADRELIERLNSSVQVRETLPSYARVTDEEFEQIDAGHVTTLPGIRQDAALSAAIGDGMPVAHYDADAEQLENFDVLAELVVGQEVVQDE
jgi:chromosome partitioning protein